MWSLHDLIPHVWSITKSFSFTDSDLQLVITAVEGGVTADSNSNNAYDEERCEYFTEAATDTSDLVNFESLALLY